jgi:hypothetical protein
MDGETIKSEFIASVTNLFDHLISEGKSVLTEDNINYIKNRQHKFLSEETGQFYDLLSGIDEKTRLVIAKDNKDDEQLIEDWNAVYGLLREEIFETLWEEICKILDEMEISEGFPIIFEVSENWAEKIAQENRSPIETIIVDNLRSDSSVFLFYDNIPEKKKAGAKSSYVFLDDDEEVVCLFDSTVFGGAKEGICLTTKAIYWKALGDEPCFVGYTDLKGAIARK